MSILAFLGKSTGCVKGLDAPLGGIRGVKMCQYLSFGDALECRSAPCGDVGVHCGVTLARHLSQWRQYLHRFMDVINAVM